MPDRIVPYRVIRRTNSRSRHTVFQTFEHREAVNYWRRATKFEPEAYYTINGKNRAYKMQLLAFPVP
jgi:hypothetical protein